MHRKVGEHAFGLGVGGGSDPPDRAWRRLQIGIEGRQEAAETRMDRVRGRDLGWEDAS